MFSRRQLRNVFKNVDDFFPTKVSIYFLYFNLYEILKTVSLKIQITFDNEKDVFIKYKYQRLVF